jgi:hypothetical protein
MLTRRSFPAARRGARRETMAAAWKILAFDMVPAVEGRWSAYRTTTREAFPVTTLSSFSATGREVLRHSTSLDWKLLVLDSILDVRNPHTSPLLLFQFSRVTLRRNLRGLARGKFHRIG